MGILSQILAGEIIIPVAKTEPEKKPTDSRPMGKCQCGSARFWRDPLGNWNCSECRPAKLSAMVREEIDIDDRTNAGQAADGKGRNPWMPAEGFHIVAIAFPGEGGRNIEYSPNASQSERRESLEGFEWFDRADARRKRKELAATGTKTETTQADAEKEIDITDQNF